MTDKTRMALVAKARDPKEPESTRKWAQRLLDAEPAPSAPELPDRPLGEAPASAAVPSKPEAKLKIEGKIGNCHDCGNPIDKRKDWQPFHKNGVIEIIHTCLACANIRWRAANGFKP